MTTRREMLRNTGLLAAAGLLAGCTPETSAPTAGDRLLLTHGQGLGIFDLGTGKWLAEPATATAAGATLAWMDGATLRLRDSRTAEPRWAVDLAGKWTPRVVRDDQVALISGAAPAASVYEPAPRTETSLLVTRRDGERKRLTLPGNFEPEAFSPDGNRLYLLDYLPPQAPDVYRVRALDIGSGEITALQTRAKEIVPPGAEEVMRGRGRHAVYDPGRSMLFTLYTHQGDHQHTGELLGVRPGAPNVHSFIHALHLAEQWAFCIDLPAPFGLDGAAGHTLALSADNGTLYAVTAAHGVVADIDPDALTVRSTRVFTPVAGEASAVSVLRGPLLIAAGRQLSILETSDRAEWQLDFDVHGLVLGSQLWAGRDGGVVGLDWANRKTLQRLDITGVTGLLI